MYSPLHLYARQQGWDIPERYEEYAFLSYDCSLRTKYLTGAEVLRFRDEQHKYFTHKPFLDLVETKFGIESRNNVVELEKIKLKRKYLEIDMNNSELQNLKLTNIEKIYLKSL